MCVHRIHMVEYAWVRCSGWGLGVGALALCRVCAKVHSVSQYPGPPPHPLPLTFQQTDDTKAIGAAFTAASKAGGGSVVFPSAGSVYMSYPFSITGSNTNMQARGKEALQVYL